MTVCSCPSPVVVITVHSDTLEYFSPRTLQAVVNRFRPVCGVISLQRSTSIPKLSRLVFKSPRKSRCISSLALSRRWRWRSTMRPATNAARALVGLA